MIDDYPLSAKIDYLCFKLGVHSMGPKYSNKYLKKYLDALEALRKAGGVLNNDDDRDVTTKNSTLKKLILKT